MSYHRNTRISWTGCKSQCWIRYVPINVTRWQLSLSGLKEVQLKRDLEVWWHQTSLVRSGLERLDATDLRTTCLPCRCRRCCTLRSSSAGVTSSTLLWRHRRRRGRCWRPRPGSDQRRTRRPIGIGLAGLHREWSPSGTWRSKQILADNFLVILPGFLT